MSKNTKYNKVASDAPPPKEAASALPDTAAVTESGQSTEAVEAGESTQKDEAELVDVNQLGKTLPAWELAALKVAARWPDGKRVTRTQFTDALARFRLRPQGGGRL